MKEKTEKTLQLEVVRKKQRAAMLSDRKRRALMRTVDGILESGLKAVTLVDAMPIVEELFRRGYKGQVHHTEHVLDKGLGYKVAQTKTFTEKDFSKLVDDRRAMYE